MGSFFEMFWRKSILKYLGFLNKIHEKVRYSLDFYFNSRWKRGEFLTASLCFAAIFGPPEVVGSVLWNRVCPTFCLSWQLRGILSVFLVLAWCWSLLLTNIFNNFTIAMLSIFTIVFLFIIRYWFPKLPSSLLWWPCALSLLENSRISFTFFRNDSVAKGCVIPR